jgi:hypothetical protein
MGAQLIFEVLFQTVILIFIILLKYFVQKIKNFNFLIIIIGQINKILKKIIYFISNFLRLKFFFAKNFNRMSNYNIRYL